MRTVLGQRIRSLRKKYGFTQDELAKMCEISVMSLRRYESDERVPDVVVVAKIAAALNITIADLVNPEEPDHEYELICDTLNSAGYRIEQGTFADDFYISPVDAPFDPESRQEIKYHQLARIVHRILDDAEAGRRKFIAMRLEADLFWPEGFKPKVSVKTEYPKLIKKDGDSDAT